jgi:hypothetical protein
VVVSGSIMLNDGTTDDPTSISLTEAGSKFLRCKVTVSDDNGCGDIDGMPPSATIFYSGASGGSACSADRRDCYTGDSGSVATAPCTYDADSCTDPTGGTDLTATYTCRAYANATEGLRYFAAPSIDAGGWNCYIVPKDESSGIGTGVLGDTPTAVTELLAFNVLGDYTDDYINYGVISRGAVSSQQVITFYNTGNMSIDTDVKEFSTYAAGMICSVGTIPIGNQNYSLTTGFEWYSATADSTTVFHVIDSDKRLHLDQSVTTSSEDLGATISSKESYWRLKMPSSGINGYCESTYVFTVAENT